MNQCKCSALCVLLLLSNPLRITVCNNSRTAFDAHYFFEKVNEIRLTLPQYNSARFNCSDGGTWDVFCDVLEWCKDSISKFTPTIVGKCRCCSCSLQVITEICCRASSPYCLCVDINNPKARAGRGLLVQFCRHNSGSFTPIRIQI